MTGRVGDAFTAAVCCSDSTSFAAPVGVVFDRADAADEGPPAAVVAGAGVGCDEDADGYILALPAATEVVFLSAGPVFALGGAAAVVVPIALDLAVVTTLAAAAAVVVVVLALGDEVALVATFGSAAVDSSASALLDVDVEAATAAAAALRRVVTRGDGVTASDAALAFPCPFGTGAAGDAVDVADSPS